MQRAKQECIAAAGPCRRTGLSELACIRCTATRRRMPRPSRKHTTRRRAYADAQADPSRYDDALYGQIDHGAQEDQQHEQAYRTTATRYQDGYDDGAGRATARAPRRHGYRRCRFLRSRWSGPAAAFAYRTYVGSPRSGEPPIIKADTGSDQDRAGAVRRGCRARCPDRMAAGDGAEKIVPREEAPVDVNAKSGPRVVFPPLNQNANPPSAASVAPSGHSLPRTPAMARCRTMSRERSGRCRSGASRPMRPRCR